ncbi:TetR/AcrR family transcriptional regulator [Helicovermis profundi]|uniref:HTH tetR-type domain-containing protein n=1 Tax=Helicovermis profundi TaxID=3065157 RepID=A0AAU9EY49_9FIRM|nr:hypothetical protein HLPR_23210 [Clostridia bacterium S502]
MSTKNNIINSSIKFFLIYGYDNTSLNMIAKDIGIKKPSLYHHFKNKEELFKIDFEYIINSLLDKIKLAANLKLDPKYMLENLISGLIEYNLNLSLSLKLDPNKLVDISSFFSSSINKFPELQVLVDSYYDFLKLSLVKIIRSGQRSGIIIKDLDREMSSYIIISTIEGLFTLSTIYSKFNITVYRQRIFENMWKSLTYNNSKSNKSLFKKKAKSKTLSIGTKW